MHYNLTTKALPALSVVDHVVIQDTSTKRWITPGVESIRVTSAITSSKRRQDVSFVRIDVSSARDLQ